jgi:hypothetical protein
MYTEKRLQYEPPRARDLSSLSVSGAGVGPSGMCIDGSKLTFQECSTGTGPLGGNCDPNGVSPQYGYCSHGDVAVEGCISGGTHH